MKFGTDGIRGLANKELTPELVQRLGHAAAATIDGQRFIVARDPRRSGTMIESALAAGMAAGGVDVELVGVMPTPALALLSATESVPAAMVSASHNPAADNGIKLFATGGRKLTDQMQADIEAAMAHNDVPAEVPTGANVGVVRHRSDAGTSYIDALAASVSGETFPVELKVVFDCANGAASGFAGTIATRLGLDAVIIADQPDGLNINDGCGSTHLDVVAKAVVDHGADIGLALDGDADRVLGVTETGERFDGDQIMAMLAADMLARGVLRNQSVVVTVMTNLGFRLAMRERNIHVVETPVGDRHVLEALAAGNHSLGGEQSGHVILPDYATTGDGLLTAVQILALMARTAEPISRLVDNAMTRLPQTLVNVAVAGNAKDHLSEIESLVSEVQAEFGDDGRVLVRASGTEPVIRVMAEARSAEAAGNAVDRIVEALK